MYRELRFDKIVSTIGQLQQRISERIPDSGLSKVCEELHQKSLEAEAEIELLQSPNKWVRSGVVVAVIVFVVTLIYTLSIVGWEFRKPSLLELIQITEALINDVLLFGAALFFLISTEIRLKRRKVLKELHELRSIAHVIDMHQLTKGVMHSNQLGTKSSPQRTMTVFELQRYLDYCSEMFSLIGKIAALYSEKLPEPDIVSAASDIEVLCTGLSRKVWQKMTILDLKQ